MEKSVAVKVGSSGILAALKESRFGYHFGKPKRPDENALTVLMPILRDLSPEYERGYITFPETDKCLVYDTGIVSEIDVENKSESDVFIRTGTLFKGSTQERTLSRSVFLMKGQKNRINVRCVHMSKATGQAGMKYGGITSSAFMQKVYGAGFAAKGQGEYWNSVAEETTKMRCMMDPGSAAEHLEEPMITSSNSVSDATSQVRTRIARRARAGVAMNADAGSKPIQATDDLAANMAAFEKNFESLLSKVKLEDDQSGVVLITEAGVQVIESFDHPASWKALHETAVKAMGTEMVKEDKKSVFEFKPEYAVELTQKVLALPFEQNEIYHHPATSVTVTGLTAKGYVGEVVEVRGEVIHLVILKQAA